MLDDGWCFALNLLAHSGQTFGKDVVFTYGPLGYLLEPRNWLHNMIDSRLLFVSIMAIWTATLAAYLISSERKLQFFLFVLCFAVAYSLHISADYHLLIIILLLSFLPLKLKRPEMLSGCTAGTLAALLILMKFNLGLSALVSVLLAAACWRLEFAAQATRSILATAASVTLTFSLLCAIYFQSAANVLSWIRGSMELASGYSTTMGIVDQNSSLTAALSLIVAFAAATLFLLFNKSQAGYLFLIALPGILLSYKHSFVRQDAHQAILFTFLAGVLAAIGLACRNLKNSVLTYLSVPVVLLVGIKAISMTGETSNSLFSSLDTSTGQRKLSRLIHPDELKAALDIETREDSSECKLPESMLARIHQAGNPPVGTLPNCIGYCPVNDLQWSPLPVLQLYSAYTPYLDQLCAEHFQSNEAPRFVIFGSNRYLDLDLGEIDHRHPLLESPLTTQSLLKNYAVVESRPPEKLILLEKRSTPLHAAYSDLKTTQHKLDEWLPIPESDGPLLACMKLAPTAKGLLLPPLYQLPEIDLEIAFPDGHRRWRMAPANLKSGLLINRIPRDYKELASTLAGRIPNQPQAARLTGAGCKLFKKDFEIKWVKVSHVQPTNQRQYGSTSTETVSSSAESPSYSCK